MFRNEISLCVILVDGVRRYAASPTLTNVNTRGDLAPDYSIIHMK